MNFGWVISLFCLDIREKLDKVFKITTRDSCDFLRELLHERSQHRTLRFHGYTPWCETDTSFRALKKKDKHWQFVHSTIYRRIIARLCRETILSRRVANSSLLVQFSRSVVRSRSTGTVITEGYLSVLDESLFVFFREILFLPVGILASLSFRTMPAWHDKRQMAQSYFIKPISTSTAWSQDHDRIASFNRAIIYRQNECRHCRRRRAVPSTRI